MIQTSFVCQTLSVLALSACSFRAGAASVDASDLPPPGPSLLRPAMGEALPPTRALLLWQDLEAVTGRAIRDYEICSTTGAMESIDEDSECPASKTATGTYLVLDPLQAGVASLWKVRGRFEDGGLSAWSAVGAFTPDNSLVAWLRLNGDATDSSVEGHNGALQNGAGFGAGIDAQALQLDGTNDYTDLGGGLALPGALTVSAWIYGNGTPASADSGIVNQGNLNYALTSHTDGRVYFYIGDGTNNLRASVSPGTWHHVAGTFNGTTDPDGMRFYLDGALAGMKASSTATTGATGDLWIGRYSASHFNGGIDNVTLYDGALSEAAVLNEYCATLAAGAAGGIDPLPAPCQP